MIYGYSKTGSYPDKIRSIKIKPDKDTLDTKKYKTKSFNIPLSKKVPKDKVIGWLVPKYTNNSRYVLVDELDYYRLDYESYAFISEKKQRMKFTAGYIPVSDGYVGVRYNPLGILFYLILFLIIFAIVGFSFYKATKVVEERNREPFDISKDVIDIENAEVMADGSIQGFTKSAEINGRTSTTISKDYPNVYLENSKNNVGLLLQYTVYLDAEKDTPIYVSDNVAAGKAAAWNAYEEPKILEGENALHYTITVYDEVGNIAAVTNVNGVKVIKK